MKKNISAANEYDYNRADIIEKFNGTHPLVMHDRIQKMNWKLNFDPTKLKAGLKFKLTAFVEKNTGYRIGEYKNYTLFN